MTKNTQSTRVEPPPPTHFVEEDSAQVSLLPGPVVRVIVGLALLWILILAYFVAEMPAK